MADIEQISVRELRVRKAGYLSTEDLLTTIVQPANVSTRVAISRPDRKVLIFINSTPELIWLQPAASAFNGAGVPLFPFGGVVSVNFEDDGDLATVEWFAVSETGSFPWQVLEIVGLIEVPAARPA